MMRKIPACLVAVVFVWSQVNAETRDWTNAQGKTITAELIEIDGDKAVLKIGTTTYPVPINTLSAADQEYLKNWMAESDSGSEAGSRAGEDTTFENWGDEWPKLISTDVTPEIETIQENEEGYIYASEHYEFHCDTKLSASVVKKFAVLFEATNEFCRALPLSMAKARTEQRHKIFLFETKANYVAAGAPADSAGVYFPDKDIIMVPLTSLGVKNTGTRYIVDYDKGNKTLPHEILHQLTDRVYYVPGARGWFSEGLAEYVGTTPYRSGKFQVDSLNTIKEYVTAGEERIEGQWIFYEGRMLGETIRLPGIKDWMLQSYGSFVGNGNLNYGAAALVVYYFFHMDGEKDAAVIKEFLKGLKQGKSGEEALEVLLNGRSYDQLEEDISKAWRSRGVTIEWN